MLTLGPWEKPRRYDIRIVDKLTGVHDLILCCVYVTSLCLNIIAIFFFLISSEQEIHVCHEDQMRRKFWGLLKFSFC